MKLLNGWRSSPEAGTKALASILPTNNRKNTAQKVVVTKASRRTPPTQVRVAAIEAAGGRCHRSQADVATNAAGSRHWSPNVETVRGGTDYLVNKLVGAPASPHQNSDKLTDEVWDKTSTRIFRRSLLLHRPSVRHMKVTSPHGIVNIRLRFGRIRGGHGALDASTPT